jgi:hypothetical protein
VIKGTLIRQVHEHCIAKQDIYANRTMPSLTSLAEGILTRAKKIDAYLESQSIAYTSFDEDTLESLPHDLQDERWALSNDAHQLKQLSRGATQSTLDTALSVRIACTSSDV